MFRWAFEHTSRETKAEKKAIWRLWSDVKYWSKWDHALEWVEINGPFTKGTKGRLKPSGGPIIDYELTEVIENSSFSDKSFLPATYLEFSHKIVETGNGSVKVTHRAEAKGLLAPILWFTLRRSLKQGMPQAVETLIQIAEEGQDRTG